MVFKCIFSLIERLLFSIILGFKCSKMALKSPYFLNKNFRGLRPLAPARGSAPGTCWGLRPHTPAAAWRRFAPPRSQTTQSPAHFNQTTQSPAHFTHSTAPLRSCAPPTVMTSCAHLNDMSTLS